MTSRPQGEDLHLWGDGSSKFVAMLQDLKVRRKMNDVGDEEVGRRKETGSKKYPVIRELLTPLCMMRLRLSAMTAVFQILCED